MRRALRLGSHGWHTQLQVEHARPGVVAGLVEVAQQLAPGPARAARQHARVGRCGVFACTAGPGAAQALPQAAEEALGQLLPVHQLQLDARGAAARKGAVERDARAAGQAGRGGRFPVLVPVVAAPVHQRHAAVEFDALQARHRAGLNTGLGGAQFQRQQVAGQHQGVGDDVVGELRLVIKRRQALIKPCRPIAVAVHDQIAVDVAHAGLLQVHQQRPQLWRAEFDITAAGQHQVTPQVTVQQRRGAAQLGMAAVVGPQAVQRYNAGHQLHGRTRLHRPRGLVPPGPRPGRQRQGHGGQRILGQAGRAQRLAHRGGQAVVGTAVGKSKGQQQGQGSNTQHAPHCGVARQNAGRERHLLPGPGCRRHADTLGRG